MSSTPRKARRSRQTLRLWAYDQAQSAIPYLASIVRSLREHALDIQKLRRQLDSLEETHGRPDRQMLIQMEEIKRDLLRLEDEYAAALAELEAIDVQLFDAVKGQALLPFVHDDQLAWYVFDLQEAQPLRAWRYQSDPDNTRRKVTAAQMR